MSKFLSEESLKNETGMFALNWRLFRSLRLFLWFLPLSIVTIIVSSIAPSFFRWYSGEFVSSSTVAEVPYLGIRVGFNLSGLVVVVAVAVIFRITAWASFEITGMWSSQGIHSQMVRAMAETRTTFFDENPSGRLINRLIRDFDEVRSTAIIFVGDFFNAIVEVASIGVVACIATMWAAPMILAVLGIFFFIQYHRSGMLSHARSISANATSKVIHRKTDLIEGREIFLLYGRSEKLLERMRKSFSEYVQASNQALLIDTWASFWIRSSVELFSLAVLLFVASALHRHQLSAALAGVIISSLYGIAGSIGWLDFATSLISRSIPHVRRVYEFVDLPKEELEERSVIPQSKPAVRELTGDIIFENYSMSYRKDSPVILQGLNLRIPFGSKTALVGRTGSGKTSIFQALLRMVYVRDGDVRIGDRSIFDADIRALRALFGVIPQSPYLFEGTLRMNLDRTAQLSDVQLQVALKAVELDYPLDWAVSEGGKNLSQGERQLICLARTIAAGKSYVLMDEPTSGLDPETDARIHRVLKTALHGKTVLTIAHRPESIGGYDFVHEVKTGKID